VLGALEDPAHGGHGLLCRCLRPVHHRRGRQPITAEWHIASYQKSLLSSLALLTSAAGAVVFGRLADKLGRKKVHVFSMQGAGLVIGPLVAIGLLKAGLHPDLAWRILLALGAVPALAVFWLRRLRETPRFLLAQAEAVRAVRYQPGLAAVRLRLLRQHHLQPDDRQADLAARQAGRATAITLAIFAVAALPGYLLAAFTIDRLGRKLMQAGGFAVIAAAFAGYGSSPGATTTVLPFLQELGTGNSNLEMTSS
jgi:MFS family permease